MKRDLARMFPALGFERLNQRRRRIMGGLLAASLAIHLGGLLVFGGWVVMRHRQEPEPVFVTPPPVRTYRPRQLEHRVKVQKRQRSSSRPSLVPRMVSMKPSNLSLPRIEMDPKLIHTSFQPKFRAVSGKGLGVGLGTGYGIGGFGGGVSAFNFFGIRGRGDRIAILMDVSVSMVEDDRGGAAGFLRVKSRISEVIKAMDEAAFFNVIAFADAAGTWKSKMVIANEENRADAKRWLNRFNTEGSYGLSNGNVHATNLGLAATGGTTRLDLALTAAFQQGADTILVISDGLPRVEKATDPTKRREYEAKLAKWRERNKDKLDNVRTVEKRVWVAGHDGKLREGGPGGAAREGRYVTRRVRVGEPRGRPRPPGKEYWTIDDFLRHLSLLNGKVYGKRGKKPPIVHCIGYQIDREGGSFLRKVAHAYKGKYRRVASLR